MATIKYNPIGIIHSPFKKPVDVPIQSASAKQYSGKVEIYEDYIEGLEDLDGFSHIILIYHFHLSKRTSLKVTPYMDTNQHGVFATRSPSRPNPIGISIVKLIKIENNLIYVSEIDIVDGTPLIDIKPYIPQFDVRTNCKIGWLEKNIEKLPEMRDDGRFSKKT